MVRMPHVVAYFLGMLHITCAYTDINYHCG